MGNSKEVLNHDATFFGIEGQLCSEIGVCNGNKLTCAGTERFTLKMGNAIFGYYIVNIVLAGGYNCTGFKN